MDKVKEESLSQLLCNPQSIKEKRILTTLHVEDGPIMWPFLKSAITGLWRKPRYRLMESKVHQSRYFLWDRALRNRHGPYFNNLDEALYYIEVNNIDCDQYRMFK